MQVFKEIKPNLIELSCIAQGMFDGVHLGHQKVILDAVKRAKLSGTKSGIVTFSDHPQFITARTPTKLINSLEERLALFEKLNVEFVLILDFDEELSRISAENYIRTVLLESLNMKYIAIGYDHRFGSQKRGDYNMLEKFAKDHNFDITVIQPFKVEGQLASSSVIRKYISNGDMTSVTKLLGRPFSITGQTVIGKQRGTAMGFPTANVNTPQNIICPNTGVYSGTVKIDGNIYPSVINVGKRPTFGDLEENIIEAHILNFNKVLYDKILEVQFLQRIRFEKKFNSIDELKDQIQKDCQIAEFQLASL